MGSPPTFCGDFGIASACGRPPLITIVCEGLHIFTCEWSIDLPCVFGAALSKSYPNHPDSRNTRHSYVKLPITKECRQLQRVELARIRSSPLCFVKGSLLGDFYALSSGFPKTCIRQYLVETVPNVIFRRRVALRIFCWWSFR